LPDPWRFLEIKPFSPFLAGFVGGGILRRHCPPRFSFPEGTQGTYRVVSQKKNFTSLYFHAQTGEHLGTPQQAPAFRAGCNFSLQRAQVHRRTVTGHGGLCPHLRHWRAPLVVGPAALDACAESRLAIVV
jgi:hypothetical protein